MNKRNLASIIMHLHPNTVPGREFIVLQDHPEQEPRLVHWDETVLGPRPTEAELMAREPEYLASRDTPDSRADRLDLPWRKLSCAHTEFIMSRLDGRAIAPWALAVLRQARQKMTEHGIP